MDPRDEGTSQGRFETFDANEVFVVVRDEDGYGVWRLDDLEVGDALERFPDTDEGYERAARRWKELTKAERRRVGIWLDRLRVTVLIGLAAWLVSSAVPVILSAFEDRPDFPGDPGEGGFERALYLLSTVSFDVWIVGTIAYLVLWMDRRRP